MTTLSRALDRMTASLENAEALDRPADLLQSVTNRLPAGKVKDLLSGTDVGHPLHPVLVTVPIGMMTSAVTLDLLGRDRRTARTLIGIGLLSAAPAAWTGWSDWNETQGAERRVGLVHAVANAVGLGLLAGSWLVRGRGRSGSALALTGMAALGSAGWLGGHLAYALGVGVDTTAFQRPPTEWTDACALDDLASGTPVVARVEDTPVLLVRQGGEILAVGDRCTHRGAPLHEGTVADGCVTCPWHDSIFDLRDGSVVQGPATRPAPTFETRTVSGRVEVRRDEQRSLRLNPAS
ncbi:MAG: Rieske 2Fe-2S domain-containing protein [Lapillicoccus sp.]